LKAVFNSSPIIFTGKLGLIEETISLFKSIYVPSGVIEEIAAKKGQDQNIAGVFSRHPNVNIKPVKEDRLYKTLRENIGKGETEAILLGFELNGNDDFVILDDKAARNMGHSLGLNVKGTLGILKILYQKNVLKIHPEKLFKKLMEIKFRVSKNIYIEIMKEFY
jgi:predicted nucleic acid-binding protein